MALQASVARAENTISAGSLERMAAALRFRTVSYQDRSQVDYRQFDSFIAFLKRSYPRTFTNLELETFSKYSLLLVWRGSSAALEPVLFDAHYDVVPIEPGTLDDWPYPPFDGVAADGYLWGRGVIDDKLAVIAYLEAIEALLEQGFQPARDLYFSFVHDEEIGGAEGAAVVARALRERGVEFPYMVGEGGGLITGTPWLAERPMAMIALAEKTYVTLTLTAPGQGGHSSMPPRDNAVVRLARAVSRVHDNPLPPRLQSPVTDMLAVLGKQSGGMQGWFMQHPRIGRPFILQALTENPANEALVRSTAALTMFNAGIKENVVPQLAVAKINMRLLPGLTVEQAVLAIENIIEDPGIEISVDSWGEAPPIAPMDAEGYLRIKSALEQAYPNAVTVPSLLVASTDTRHYQGISPAIYRIRPYRMPIGDAARVHGTGERLALDAVPQAVAFARVLLREAAAP